jgi:toxin ParE1/3/4
LQVGFDYLKAHASALPRVEDYNGRHDVRRHLLKRFPYTIVAAQIANEFVVIAIAHTRRRPFYWLDRLN